MKLKIIAGLVITALSLSGCTGKPQSNGPFYSVDAQEFRELAEKGGTDQVLLDIRTPAEYSQGHIKSAINIDFYSPEFRTRLEELDKTKTYLLYCHSGNRTSKTLPLMRELGFQKVIALKHGLNEWSGNKYPLEK